jgi:hypothetical protein
MVESPLQHLMSKQQVSIQDKRNICCFSSQHHEFLVP